MRKIILAITAAFLLAVLTATLSSGAYAASTTPGQILKREIKEQFGVTIYDNDGLDEQQLGVIESILRAIPKGLYNLEAITVNDFLNGTVPNETHRVNIFGFKVGAISEDGIPDDKGQLTDTFSIVAVHEINHNVNYYLHFVKNEQWFSDKETQLIRQAGDEPLQYIRSQVAEAPCGGERNNFFIDCPQEFFASLSNAYFQDTQATIELGITRFRQGYAEPINQALHFAETYSPGGGTTKAYMLHKNGTLAAQDVPIKRDKNGNINSIAINGAAYEFVRDKDGNVLSIGPANSIKYTLQLKKGWNLFSMPVFGPAQFASFPTTCNYKSSAWKYDETINRYEKATRAINSRDAYWIKVSSGCSAEIAGSTYTPDDYFGTGISLAKGWNFIGGIPQAADFNDLKGTCAFAADPYWFDTAANKWQAAKTMEPGKGYAIAVSDDCKLQQAGPPEFP